MSSAPLPSTVFDSQLVLDTVLSQPIFGEGEKRSAEEVRIEEQRKRFRMSTVGDLGQLDIESLLKRTVEATGSKLLEEQQKKSRA